MFNLVPAELKGCKLEEIKAEVEKEGLMKGYRLTGEEIKNVSSLIRSLSKLDYSSRVTIPTFYGTHYVKVWVHIDGIDSCYGGHGRNDGRDYTVTNLNLRTLFRSLLPRKKTKK